MQTNIEYIEQLKHIIDVFPYNFIVQLNKAENSSLLKWIIDSTHNVLDSERLVVRINWILHNRSDYPRCPTCNKQYGFNTALKINIDYNKHCSRKCSNKDPHVFNKAFSTKNAKHDGAYKKYFSNKVKTTKKERYGDGNFNNSSKHRQTIAKNIEKNPLFYKERNIKTNKTSINKYVLFTLGGAALGFGIGAIAADSFSLTDVINLLIDKPSIVATNVVDNAEVEED